jgi:hypothetical protein
MKKMLRAMPVLAAPDEGGEEAAAEARTQNVEFTWEDCFDMICQLSLEPKYVQENPGEGEVLLDDLDMVDFTALTQAMTNASGLTQAAMQANPT